MDETKEFSTYFKTNDMLKATILYEENDKYPNHVAIAACVAATFDEDH